MLVSVTENIDETPSGMLVHGIMSTIAEFYSRDLAGEVAKGLRQKASTGGTVTKAPLGDINTHERDQNGRKIRTVAVDPGRAPLIVWAFKTYSSSAWALSTLLDELTTRGLSTLHRILQNLYYKGDAPSATPAPAKPSWCPPSSAWSRTTTRTSNSPQMPWTP